MSRPTLSNSAWRQIFRLKAFRPLDSEWRVGGQASDLSIEMELQDHVWTRVLLWRLQHIVVEAGGVPVAVASPPSSWSELLGGPFTDWETPPFTAQLRAPRHCNNYPARKETNFKA